MLISPVFIKVKRENKNVFYGMTGCAILLNIFFSKILYLYIKNTSSILWFHYYIAFFLIGMLASDFDIRKKWKSIFGIIAFIGMVIYLYFNVKTGDLPQAHYGNWYFYIYLIGDFFLFKSIEIQNEKVKEIISAISSKTFLIYLIGFPFSFLIDHFVHFNMKQNVLMTSIIVFIILLLSLTLVEKLKTKILEIIYKSIKKS